MVYFLFYYLLFNLLNKQPVKANAFSKPDAIIWLPTPTQQPRPNRNLTINTMVRLGGDDDLKPGCLAGQLLPGLGQPQINP
jgi:hypothetical protein